MKAERLQRVSNMLRNDAVACLLVNARVKIKTGERERFEEKSRR